MGKLKQYDTAAIIKDDKAHFLHPWQEFDKFEMTGALPIARAEGPYIYDTEGNQLLDAIGGMWCTNIGLGRSEMAEANVTTFTSRAEPTPPPTPLARQRGARSAPGRASMTRSPNR